MLTRDYSSLTRTQLLELLEELQNLIDVCGGRLPVDLSDAGPSKLESALVERHARREVESRIAPHPQLLAAIVEASADAISSRAIDGTLLTWNKGAEKMFGYTAQEVLGTNNSMLFPESARTEFDEINARLLRGESITDMETVRRRKDGSLVHVSLNISPMLENGLVTRVCSIARDITERKNAEIALHEVLARERERTAELEAVLDAVPAAVFMAHDKNCTQIAGNPAAAELLRMPPGANMSKSAPEEQRPMHFRIFHDGKEVVPEDLPMQKAAREGIEIRGFEQEVTFADGTVKHLIGNAKPLRNAADEVYGAVAAFVDITERKDAEDRIRRLAHFDPLTSLPNRILLMDRLEQALASSQRNQSRTGVIFMDLDHFKEINDRLGHHVGDLLLQQVADRVRNSIREVDTVSRLGGDEFIIVLPELHQVEDAAAIAQKILSVIAEDYVVAGQKLSITSSIGIAIYPDHGRDPSMLIRVADKAMYEAKQAGRNTWRFAGPQTGEPDTSADVP